jgi:hypothetical protein
LRGKALVEQLRGHSEAGTHGVRCDRHATVAADGSAFHSGEGSGTDASTNADSPLRDWWLWSLRGCATNGGGDGEDKRGSD